LYNILSVCNYINYSSDRASENIVSGRMTLLLPAYDCMAMIMISGTPKARCACTII
jgi:hypothetical protein